MDDAVCLAVTHRLLGYEGFRRVVRLRRRENSVYGSWAGARILTAGEYIRELPKGMLTAAEDEEMKKHKDWHPQLGFFHYATDVYKWVAPHDWVHPSIPPAARPGDKPALKRVSRHRRDKLRVRLLLEDTSRYYDPRATWALCNLDRQEYIRASAVASMKIHGPRRKVVQEGSRVEGPFVTGDNTVVDLGTVAIVLTASGQSVQRPWAGECLEILDIARLRGEGWKDVSRWGVDLVHSCVKMYEGML